MPTTQAFRCTVCGREQASVEGLEGGQVRSNVRAFQQEVFRLWRCPGCASILARDEVELDRYYRAYPFHNLPVDWRYRIHFDHQVARLRRAGLRPGQRVLDYGCGGGHFVAHLRERGFDAVGFDAYSESFSDPAVLNERYACVFSQDVIEHVPSPTALLDRFHELALEGGVIAIGTPNATAIDLGRSADFEHVLHQPYHRQLLSKQALLDAGQARGWQLLRYYPSHFTNTPFPFLNFRFYLYYASLYDNSLDCFIEPIRATKLLSRLPVSLWWGLLGYFMAPETDVMAVFRRS